jgi:hypothetical protein
MSYRVGLEARLTEQRKSKRFELKLPLEIVRAGSLPMKTTGETRNLSSSGVLFSLDTPLPIGESIEYIITLPVTRSGGPAVRLRCMGKVVRHEKSAAAATLERYEFVRD